MCLFSLLFKGNIFCGKDAGWLAQCGVPLKSVPQIFHVSDGNSHGC